MPELEATHELEFYYSDEELDDILECEADPGRSAWRRNWMALTGLFLSIATLGIIGLSIMLDSPGGSERGDQGPKAGEWIYCPPPPQHPGQESF